MPFAAALRDSLHVRRTQVPTELTHGEALEEVLNRHLRAVEANATGELITSVLLRSADGRRLSHGAGPSLPRSYRDAIDGTEIGPHVGSCGTAAYVGWPVYVSDIESNPLWVDYRDLALSHGLRSCWSTPIRAPDGQLIGTFAIYRRTVGDPSSDEIEAIDMIAEHVAKAILLSRAAQDLRPLVRNRPNLRLVADEVAAPAPLGEEMANLLRLVVRLQAKSAELDAIADQAEDREDADALRSTAGLTRRLVDVLRHKIGGGRGS